MVHCSYDIEAWIWVCEIYDTSPFFRFCTVVAALLEENERLRVLLESHGVIETGLSTQTVTLCDDSSGQLQIETPDEPDRSGFESVNPDHGVETGFHLTRRMIYRRRYSYFNCFHNCTRV